MPQTLSSNAGWHLAAEQQPGPFAPPSPHRTALCKASFHFFFFFLFVIDVKTWSFRILIIWKIVFAVSFSVGTMLAFSKRSPFCQNMAKTTASYIPITFLLKLAILTDPWSTGANILYKMQSWSEMRRSLPSWSEKLVLFVGYKMYLWNIKLGVFKK